MKKRILFMSALALSAITFAQVGINTETPSATLDIVSSGNDGTTKALEINNSAATEMVTVLDNGNVGIGILPTFGTRLRVKSFKVNSWPLWVDSSTGRFGGIYEEAGANAGQLKLYINDGSGYAINIAAKGNSWINGGGNFGLNNTSPTYSLDVKNSTNAFRFLNGTGAYERLQTSIDSNGVNMAVLNTTGGAIPFIFTGGTTERMRINADGNVGIGTTTPGSKLSVVGLAEYADNAAALVAGLVAGDFYRTGDLLKVVH